jgi:hypothetical protein
MLVSDVSVIVACLPAGVFSARGSHRRGFPAAGQRVPGVLGDEVAVDGRAAVTPAVAELITSARASVTFTATTHRRRWWHHPPRTAPSLFP